MAESTTALRMAGLVSNCRYTVFSATPAAWAMERTEVATYPESTNSRPAASTIRWRVSAADASREGEAVRRGACREVGCWSSVPCPHAVDTSATVVVLFCYSVTVSIGARAMALPSLDVLSVKIPVSDLAVSRAWYARSSGCARRWSGPTTTGSCAASGFSGLGSVTLALREHPEAAAATDGFGFVNVRVPGENDLDDCAAHLDALGIRHTPVISAARGRLVGFHDPDGHELSFYAETHQTGVRSDAVRSVRAAGQEESAAAAAPPAGAAGGGRS